ncbi:class II aldolase/adducin family protein [Bradyrhizobium sp. SZCCHNS1054]|uniref:class II aldolase/adducin family protein n=1 Tax=Bradyrhizobium sp. SZCCHNS1054 TaxID=3057301 RepID=UPI002916D4BD|nr:class II aldolase/adducin family protein [Bradyrhizobium sp. SZCCHNS1054]
MVSHLIQRQSIVDICHCLSDEGYLAGTGGNVALRVDEDLFAVTPSALDYAAMSAGDIALLKLSNLEQVEGSHPPSVESGIHATVLKARPTRRASIHTHQPIASAVALGNIGFEWRPGVDRRTMGERVGLAAYRPSGTRMLLKAVTRSLQNDVHAYLLASHGVVCSGVDLNSARELLHEVEASAAFLLHIRFRARSGLLDAKLERLIDTALRDAQYRDKGT